MEDNLEREREVSERERERGEVLLLLYLLCIEERGRVHSGQVQLRRLADEYGDLMIWVVWLQGKVRSV